MLEMTPEWVIANYENYIKDGCNNIEKELLDLAKRQKAEIERLNVELAGMRGAAESYKIHYDKAQTKIKALKEELDGETVENMRLGHEVERLQADNIKLHTIIPKMIITAKAEAIKEFAERLKEKADRGFWQEHSYVDTEDIDNLVKEMEGADK